MEHSNLQLKLKLQFYFVKQFKILQTESDLKGTIDFLEQLLFILNLSDSNLQIEQQFGNISINSVQKEFKDSFYLICFKEILKNLKFENNHNQFSLLTIKTLLVKIMSETNFSDSFNVLYEFCTTSR